MIFWCGAPGDEVVLARRVHSRGVMEAHFESRAMNVDAEGGSTLIRARWELRPRGGRPVIRGDLRALPGPAPRTAVVICHGFKGFREWGFFPALARAIAQHGHAAITFDFSHNGVGDDGVDFSALEKFGRQTHSGNLDDLQLVLDALGKGLFRRPPERIALLGHSRGGAEAILTAAEDDRVNALVTWGAVASLEDRWSQAQIECWEQGETVRIANARTGQEMPIEPAFWEDLDANRDRFKVGRAAARLKIPWLIVHGEADETVPVEDAQELFARASDDAELVLVEGGAHTFGATHPYAGAPDELRMAAQTTLEWLDAHLL